MITRLPQDVIDRIAAGEVVERPASVVKELLENALDSGATEISVRVDDGGLRLVRVADNGGGIPPDELPLAFAPHATSKLCDVDDLFHIASLGFRGEALCSIAAVSHARLVSRTAGAASAFCVEATAGRDVPPVAVAGAPGTVVEVRDLFFNTPARRRFLGSPTTEAARCREVCAALSLVNPGLKLRFESDGRERFSATGAGTLAQRAAAVYGDDLLAEMIPVGGRAEGLSVEGLLSLPAFAKARPRAQQLFVNGRLVRDRAVLAAARTGCRDFLPGALQPSWILCLTVDPLRLDVNVHPTKAEVRFRDADAVFALVRSACRQALLGADLTPRVQVAASPGGEQQAGNVAMPAWLPRGRGTGSPQAPAPPQAGAWSVPERKQAPSPAGHARFDDAERAPAASLLSAAPRARPACVQVLDTYIVHPSPDGLVLVDQHALHERILYARLQAALAAGKLESQRLLLPEPVRLSPALHARALESAAELARLGLQFSEFGPDTVAIQAIPSVLRNESLRELLTALIDPPDLHGGIPTGLDRRLFTMACHSAVRAGDVLDSAEMESLLRQGAELEHDATCPHGRPTRLLIERAELERLFKRSGF